MVLKSCHDECLVRDVHIGLCGFHEREPDLPGMATIQLHGAYYIFPRVQSPIDCSGNLCDSKRRL